jgi:hypothetical protein
MPYRSLRQLASGCLLGWGLTSCIKIMKVFLWMETDTMQAGKCLVAWPYIHRPLELGELDLKTFGMVLRLRWLWLS